jgi:hypothetical protein
MTERKKVDLEGLPAAALEVEERSDETPSAAGRTPPGLADPEVVGKPKRRRFTAEYRLLRKFCFVCRVGRKQAYMPTGLNGLRYVRSFRRPKEGSVRAAPIEEPQQVAAHRRHVLVLMALVVAAGCVTSGGVSAAPFILGPPPGDAPTRVSIGFFLSEVSNVDEQAETFEFEAILTLKWKDVRLAFDPAEVGVPEKIYQGAYQFAEVFPGWWPQVILSNESGEFDNQGVLVRVQPDGSLTLIQEITAVAESPMELRRFPFDRQHLEAVFEVLGVGANRVVLEPDPETTGVREGGLNTPEWDLGDVRVGAREYEPTYEDGHTGTLSRLIVTLDASRRSGYMVRIVVLPLTLIVLLTFSVFWMDRESLGDRMDISFIGLLTLVAYQIIVGDSMPQISYFTLMSGFLYSTFVLLAAGVVVNLVVSKLDQTGRMEAGNRVDERCRWAFPLVFFGGNALSAVYFLSLH